MGKAETILVLGSGGREHAICWHLESRKYDVICSPGSDAISRIAKTHPLEDFKKLADYCKKEGIIEVIVGPEKYLAEGVSDFLTAEGLSVFGPTQSAARLETDKAWAKDFCIRHKIPTARSATITDIAELKDALMNFKPPFVIKASGLAQGKGVWIGSDWEEALRFSESALREHRALVIEEFIEGEEISYFSLVDGEKHLFLGAAQDHKRLLENDRGPNTGGMGAYSPTPQLTTELQEKIEKKVVEKVLAGLKADKIEYRGFLFLGFMIHKSEPYLLEFNCRLGDPETQALMMRLDDSLLELIRSLKTDKPRTAKMKNGVSLNAVIAARGYPENPASGFALEKIDEVPADLVVFHSGTKLKDKEWTATGGRLFSVNVFKDSLLECQQAIYPWIETFSFHKNITYRRDIGVKAYRHLLDQNDYA